MKTVLVTGASGLIGGELTQKLKNNGWEVRKLSRQKRAGYYLWNPQNHQIDESVFENLDAIIHLAGATISKRWTKNYKVELYNSRVETLDFLLERIQKNGVKLKTLISASGVNYYGTETTQKVYTENDPAGSDYLGNLCSEWEQTAFDFEKTGARVCTVRTAVVLSTKGGMLKQLFPMAKLNLISPLGDGRQIVPWIHIDDLTNLYMYLLENDHLNGAFNAAATETVNSKEFTKILVKALNRKILLPNTPGFLLKLVFGETASIMLMGSAVSNQKIKNVGFRFKFDKLENAIKNLVDHNRPL